MYQDIGLTDLVKGTLEGLYKLCGQFTYKTYGITQQEGYVLYDNLADGGVQGGKELILGKNVRFGQ